MAVHNDTWCTHFTNDQSRYLRECDTKHRTDKGNINVFGNTPPTMRMIYFFAVIIEQWIIVIPIYPNASVSFCPVIIDLEGCRTLFLRYLFCMHKLCFGFLGKVLPGNNTYFPDYLERYLLNIPYIANQYVAPVVSSQS